MIPIFKIISHFQVTNCLRKLVLSGNLKNNCFRDLKVNYSIFFFGFNFFSKWWVTGARFHERYACGYGTEKFSSKKRIAKFVPNLISCFQFSARFSGSMTCSITYFRVSFHHFLFTSSNDDQPLGHLMKSKWFFLDSLKTKFQNLFFQK